MGLLSDASAGVKLILRHLRLHSPLAAYFCNERLRRISADERSQEGLMGKTLKVQTTLKRYREDHILVNNLQLPSTGSKQFIYLFTNN